MTKSELRIKQMGLPLIISSVTNDINEHAKLSLTSFPKTTTSICFNLLQVSPSVPPFKFAMIFIPSCHVLRSYFCVSLSLVQVTTVSILMNFTTQSSITKNKKKEGNLTCFFSSFSSMIDGSSCFSGSATGTSAVSDFSLLRLFLFSFFLSFSCFSFLSDLSLRCLRLDSLDSVF